MWSPTRKSSGPLKRAKLSLRLTRPSRRDLTSVPLSTSPASTRSSTANLRWTSRFRAMGFSPSGLGDIFHHKDTESTEISCSRFTVHCAPSTSFSVQEVFGRGRCRRVGRGAFLFQELGDFFLGLLDIALVFEEEVEGVLHGLFAQGLGVEQGQRPG